MYIICLFKRLFRLPKYFICKLIVKELLDLEGMKYSKTIDNYIFCQIVVLNSQKKAVIRFLKKYYMS